MNNAILYFKNVSPKIDVLDILVVKPSANTVNTLQQINMMDKIFKAETVTMNITKPGGQAT